MTKEEALQIVAKEIYNKNNYNSTYSLVPSGFVEQVKDYNIASDILSVLFKATHFKIKWIDEEKKKVAMVFGKGTGYGIDINVIFDEDSIFVLVIN
jgi:hypothetical protein